MLRRRVEWRSPGGRQIRVSSTRFVSFVQRAVLGIAYEVENLDGSARVVLQSGLVANEELPSAAADPRWSRTWL